MSNPKPTTTGLARTLASALLLAMVLSLVAGTVSAQDESAYDMQFRNARIDDILRILADRYDVNVAVLGEIASTVTVNLSGMELTEALDVLLEGSRWVWRKEGEGGKVIRVLPGATPVTEVYQLAYTDATALAAVITAQVEEVTVNPEAHSNSLLVSGPIESVREVEWLIRNVDRYRAQVSIRAEMVEVTLNDQDTRGVDLTVLMSGTDADVEFRSSFRDNTETSTLDVFTLRGDFDISGVLAAISEERDARLLSSPTITTLDNQAAKVHVGERVPYQRATTETETGATLAEVEFMDVGVKLEVTPTVSDDETLYLKIHGEVSEVLDQSVQNVPRIGTREANTRVLVRHGETVVIGGLMKDNRTVVTKKVPLLGSIPILGYLFRRDSVKVDKTEFLVFITPQILSDPSQMQPGDGARALREHWPPATNLHRGAGR